MAMSNQDKMKTIENPIVLNVPRLVQMIGGQKPNMALVDKFIGKYEKSSLEPAIEKLYNSIIARSGKDAELHSHTIKGSSA